MSNDKDTDGVFEDFMAELRRLKSRFADVEDPTINASNRLTSTPDDIAGKIYKPEIIQSVGTVVSMQQGAHRGWGIIIGIKFDGEENIVRSSAKEALIENIAVGAKGLFRLKRLPSQYDGMKKPTYSLLSSEIYSVDVSALPNALKWCGLLKASYEKFVGQALVKDESLEGERLVQALYDHEAVILSDRYKQPHPTQGPKFCFANAAAQKLFGYNWDEFSKTPSSRSAEPEAQENRIKLLERANKNGFIDDYSGIRIDKNGKRFQIENVILWNVCNSRGQKLGQAAMFKDFKFL